LFDLVVFCWAQLGEVGPFFLLFYAHGRRYCAGAEPKRVGIRVWRGQDRDLYVKEREMCFFFLIKIMYLVATMLPNDGALK
jgi:hypothetical protein